MDSSRPNTPGTSDEGGLSQVENYVTGTKKLSAIIGKTQQTTLKLIQAGKLKAVIIGGTYRVYESELRRFLTQGNHPDPQPLSMRTKREPQGEPDDVNDA